MSELQTFTIVLQDPPPHPDNLIIDLPGVSLVLPPGASVTLRAQEGSEEARQVALAMRDRIVKLLEEWAMNANMPGERAAYKFAASKIREMQP